MWELLADIFKQMLMSTISAGMGYGAQQLSGGGAPPPPRGGPAGGAPGVIGPSGSTSRPMSMNSPGGMLGAAPVSGSPTPGLEEGPSGGTGFASLNPGNRKGGFALPPPRPGI